MELNYSDLKQRWDTLRREQPELRIRNAADQLGVSEAELVALDCGNGTTRLDGGWGSLLMELELLGELMALTRNDACVHEKTGVYRNVKMFDGHIMGLVLDEEIDLRLFMSHWHYGFAVETPWNGSSEGIRRSLQFFDRDGEAVHKVFLTRKSDVAAYNALVEKYRHADQSPELQVEPVRPESPEKSDAEIDVADFLQGWRDLKDTHDFFPLLKTYGVSRTQALRLAEGEFVERVEKASLRQVLEQASETQTPIMVFVGSRGCIQIHTGPVKTLKAHGPWYNVLDPGFQLHLNETMVDQAWIVRKPTNDGVVTSLELFDAQGGVIAMFFGKRKPGIPELGEWRDIIDALPRQEAVVA
jgi:putative hemin transport protein